MGVLTDILIAYESEAKTIGETETPWEKWPSLHAQGYDLINFASLLCILNGQEWRDEVLDQFSTLYQASDEESWITLLPNQLVMKLANLSDEAVLNVASQWVRDEDMEGSDIFLLQDFLEGLRELSQKALSANQSLLMWQSL